MADPKLKHCPFCDGAPTYVKHEVGMRGTRGFDSWHAVACRACCATIGAYDRRFRSKDDAAAAWNLRPVPHGVARPDPLEGAPEVCEGCGAIEARGEAHHHACPRGVGDTRSCTCHPDDNPPKPCPRKFALSECRAAAGGVRGTALSEFIRRGTPEEKAMVYGEVMDKVVEQQRATVDGVNPSDQSQEKKNG